MHMMIPSIHFFKRNDRRASNGPGPSTSNCRVRAPATAARTRDIVMERAWRRETAGAAPIAAGYPTFGKVGALADRLRSARAAARDRIEFHELAMLDGAMRTRPPPDGLDIPAGAVVDFPAKDDHFVFIGLKSPPRAGASTKTVLALESSEVFSRFSRWGSPRIEAAISMRMATPASALSRDKQREARRRRSTRSRKADKPAGRASKMGCRRPTHASAQDAKCPVTNNAGTESRQTSRHLTHYAICGAQRLRARGNSLRRNKCYIYIQLQNRLKIRLELVCATQYYIFTINKPPESIHEFPCWRAADSAMCIRDSQTGDSSRFDPDRLSPTPRIKST